MILVPIANGLIMELWNELENDLCFDVKVEIDNFLSIQIFLKELLQTFVQKSKKEGEDIIVRHAMCRLYILVSNLNLRRVEHLLQRKQKFNSEASIQKLLEETNQLLYLGAQNFSQDAVLFRILSTVSSCLSKKEDISLKQVVYCFRGLLSSFVTGADYNYFVSMICNCIKSENSLLDHSLHPFLLLTISFTREAIQAYAEKSEKFDEFKSMISLLEKAQNCLTSQQNTTLSSDNNVDALNPEHLIKHCVTLFSSIHDLKSFVELDLLVQLVIVASTMTSTQWTRYRSIGYQIHTKMNPLLISFHENKRQLEGLQDNLESITQLYMLLPATLTEMFTELSLVSITSDPIFPKTNFEVTLQLLCALLEQLLSQASTYLDLLCVPISILLTWLACSTVLRWTHYSYICKLHESLAQFFDSTLQLIDPDIDKITNSLLQYQLPEDVTGMGLYSYPLEFCISDRMDQPLSATFLSCPHRRCDLGVGTVHCEQPQCQMLRFNIASYKQNTSSDHVSTYKSLIESNVIATATCQDTTSVATQHMHIKSMTSLSGSTSLEAQSRFARWIVMTSGTVYHNELKAIEKSFKQKSGSTSLATNHRIIIVDGSNVALRHGGISKRHFSTKGIQIVLKHYVELGHRVVVFVPETMADYDCVAMEKRKLCLNPEKYSASHKIPDTVTPLIKLAEQGLLVRIPAKDYDDSYMLQYAKNHNGFIVSNDMFRDYIYKNSTTKDVAEAKQWVKSHVISFAFAGDLFIPNPHFQFPSAPQEYPRYRQSDHGASGLSKQSKRDKRLNKAEK